MHHKRRRPKNRRGGCLMCKAHKVNGAKHKKRAAELRRIARAGIYVADELMAEFVSKRRAANWGIINDNMVMLAKAARKEAGDE